MIRSSALPTLAWTFISSLPVRVWRFVIDSWDSITRVADWAWKALKGRTACLLANHGLIATGPTIGKAMWLAIEVETLAKQYTLSLALGGSLDNAVVVDHARILNPGGLRMADEFVRHKMLDAVGAGFDEERDRVGAAGGRFPCCVAGARGALAEGFAVGLLGSRLAARGGSWFRRS